jgi:hypothetical protein
MVNRQLEAPASVFKTFGVVAQLRVRSVNQVDFSAKILGV